MKMKTFLAAAATVFVLSCGTPYRATDASIGVPESTQRVFFDQYPNSTDIVWSTYDPNVVILNEWELTGWQIMDESDYVVRFTDDGDQYYAWYDSNGDWIGTARVVRDYSLLPATFNSSYVTIYPGYTITSAHREYYKDKEMYEVVLKDSNDKKVVLLVDSNGNIVKTKVKD
jgi:hypothetical protein